MNPFDVAKVAWRTFVTAGMFVVRMLTLALMTLLQLTVGGAEIKPEVRPSRSVRGH